nr:unnamed protein product [Callosobruchus analis]
METIQQKKERGPNFLPQEKKLLLHLTGKYKNIIENKKSDSVTWREKDNIWRQIETEFNGTTTGLTRTAKQLKMKYESVKKELKKRYMEHKAHIQGTGGGEEWAPPKPHCEEEEKELLSTISVAAEGLTSETDSDVLYGITSISTEKVAFEPVVDVVTEWVSPSTKYLRTPLHEALQSQAENDENIATVEAQEAGSRKEWARRRRPVLKRKRKNLSSASAKFEELVEQKLKLVRLQLQATEEARQQQQVEHRMRMHNLKLQHTIMTHQAKQQSKTPFFDIFFSP